MKLRLLSLLAVLCVTAWASQHVSAQTWSGAGPHSITTAAELAQLATDVNAGQSYSTATFELANDIDLDAEGYGVSNGGQGWTPIGIYGSGFSGTFDGAGYVISGLFIDDGGLEDAGLFGHISGGTVKNLGVKNVNIKGYRFVGGLAGSVYTSGSVINCYATGTVSGNGDDVGGLVGIVEGSSVSYSYATATVSSTSGYGSYVGGLAGGVLNGSVTNCYAPP